MNGDEEEDAEELLAVDEEEEGVATWLMEAAGFSSGLPLRSKNVSAVAATSFAVMVSTSLPIISLMRGGIVFNKCSLRMRSIVTSLVSSSS